VKYLNLKFTIHFPVPPVLKQATATKTKAKNPGDAHVRNLHSRSHNHFLDGKYSINFLSCQHYDSEKHHLCNGNRWQ